MGTRRLAKWFPTVNARRADLIDKLVDGVITPDEQTELDDLQKKVGDEVERVHGHHGPIVSDDDEEFDNVLKRLKESK